MGSRLVLEHPSWVRGHLGGDHTQDSIQGLKSILLLLEPICAIGHGVAALCCATNEDRSWVFQGYSLTGVSTSWTSQCPVHVVSLPLPEPGDSYRHCDPSFPMLLEQFSPCLGDVC